MARVFVKLKHILLICMYGFCYFYKNIGWQGEKQPVQVMQGQPRGPCYTGERAYLAGPHG